jgi:hypothetical protein
VNAPGDRMPAEVVALPFEGERLVPHTEREPMRDDLHPSACEYRCNISTTAAAGP